MVPSPTLEVEADYNQAICEDRDVRELRETETVLQDSFAGVGGEFVFEGFQYGRG